MEVDGYKFIEPEDVNPTTEDISRAQLFLVESGYGEDSEDFLLGVDLVSRMLATAQETLEDAPIKWRFAADLDAPDERCILLLAQKHHDGISRELMVVSSFEKSIEVREAFMSET